MLDPNAPTDETAYRQVFHHAPAHGIALLDAAGVVVDLNPAGERLTGVAAGDAIGRPYAWLRDRLGAPGQDSAARALERARGGETDVLHGWIAAPEGGRRWCESTLAAIDEPGGGFVVILADVTTAQRSKVPHPESEERFTQALARSPVHVFSHDADLRYVWAPSVIDALGLDDAQAALGRTDAELLGDAAAPLTAVKRDALEHDAGRRAEVAIRAGAREFAYDITVEPLHGPGGAVVGVTGVAIDITDRRRIEDELRRSRELLAEAEHLARLGNWEWDIVHDEIRWSDGLYEIYGLPPGATDARWAARGQREQRVHPDDHERVEAAVRAALETAGGIDMEYRIVRPDGRVRRVHGRAEVVVDAGGRPVRMTGTAQDVTEIRAAEEALERTAAELGRRAAELHEVAGRPGAEAVDVARVLTPRQVEILSLIAEGLGNADIAVRLFLSETTIKWHVRQILRKLGVANRAEAVARYVRSQPPGD
jgi:PAS domain S-box-containing protein